MKKFFRLIVLSVCLFLLAAPCSADQNDPFDDFSFSDGISSDPDEDQAKSAEQLLQEAYLLLSDERLLDARTKLLRVLKKNPKEYKAHIMLASYYMVHVGHFRLALKYVKQALSIFTEKFGAAPYEELTERTEHAHLLYLLSQARLNLDNYQGALDVLDEYTSYGYYSSWYAGSRAWILMKLGRMDEATRIARLGVLAGAEPGRTLNMLGILLSMQHQRQASLDVFREAINYEMSLGEMGQPATPLNNSGEVYREIFREDEAERAWLKATSLPDGCEHVLPSLNLAVLYMEQLRIQNAKRTIDNFEACIAQYPLRNGEEHRALVHLARGRIALHSGAVDEAISHLEAALDRRQWFGKIGTSSDDLRAGALISLAQALRRKNNHLRSTSFDDPLSWLKALKEQASNWVRSKWLMRQARQVLIGKLNSLEDIYIRHTDSMLEYPTLGEFFASLPRTVLQRRVHFELEQDDREKAKNYYDAYLTEADIGLFGSTSGPKELERILGNLRERYDDALQLHLRTLQLSFFGYETATYHQRAETIFLSNRAQLRNTGHPLPVDLSNLSPAFVSTLTEVNFLAAKGDARYRITGTQDSEGNYTLQMVDKTKNITVAKAQDQSLSAAANLLSKLVFTEPL